jgi:hypothetical protein
MVRAPKDVQRAFILEATLADPVCAAILDRAARSNWTAGGCARARSIKMSGTP